MPFSENEINPPSPYNIANMVTVGRILLVPVFAVLIVVSGMDHLWWQALACLVFLIASITDFVDGWLARSRGLVTAFGKLADPIADKALIGTAVVLLSIYELLPWWVTAVILLREVGITLLRLAVIRRGVIAASHGGKIKTVLQITAIAWYVFPWPEPFSYLGPWIMGVAVILTVATGVEYLVRMWLAGRKDSSSAASMT